MAFKKQDRILLTAFTGRHEIFVGRGNVIPHPMVEDARDPLRLRIKDQAGAAIALSSARFTLVRKIDGTVKIDKAAMAVQTATNELDYAWTAADVDTPGEYWGEVEITPSGGTAYPIPELIDISIRPKLAT